MLGGIGAPPEYSFTSELRSSRFAPSAFISAMNTVIEPMENVGRCSRIASSMTAGSNR